jgi:cytochrome c
LIYPQQEGKIMKLTQVFAMAGLLLSFGLSHNALAADAATAEEVVKKVSEASEALAKAKEAGLADFKGEKSKWAWKDTYVFVFDCKADKMLAHPTLEGKPILALKDKKGKEFFKDLCKVAEGTHGGWVGYMWTKPKAEGEFQKITYVMSVKGTTYQVAAGIYDDKANVDDLNKKLGGEHKK